MLNKNLLRAAMARNGYNQKQLCAEIKMAQPTFSRKLRKGVFGTDEVEAICKVLLIEDPVPIFLAREVTCQDTLNQS